jgi:SAM-dependent methyltransferase
VTSDTTTAPARYDRIGAVYARHRRPDPRVAGQIAAALADAETVVNVGAGTGSYEPAGRQVVAVEPSAVMIAQRPRPSAPVVQARAERLPFDDGRFDAAMALLTVHHWADPAAGLAEMGRVARRVVVFTFDPEVHGSLWLFEDYVPEAVAPPSTVSMPPEEVAAILGAERIEPVPVPADCRDGFNWAYWRRPWAYLDPEVRACISGLALLDHDLVAERMERLGRDLADGTWRRRHGHLLDRETVDGGLRLVVRDG